MSPVDSTATLGVLVAERPARASLFERLGLEYCCGGRQTLSEACQQRGLEIDTVRAALKALDAASGKPEGFEDTDWRRAGIGELCAHIVLVHHDGLRDAFPKIEALLSTVVRAHGATHPDLRELQHAFAEIRAELEPHLAAEENELFPACLAREQCGTRVEESLLEEHEREHAAVGHGLAALRVLGGGYERERALCGTHRALLEALTAFELDLHQHVHEENNILMPRVHELNAPVKATPARPSDSLHAPRDPGYVQEMEPLPRCCQAWIAEQTHSWAGRRR
jgi:regulator of cell morphogenesis and NO signaling